MPRTKKRSNESGELNVIEEVKTEEMGFNKRLVVDLAEKFSDPEDGGLGAFVCRICASEADGRGFPLPFSLASGGGQVESEAGGRARGRGAVAVAVTVAGREPALSTSPRAAHLTSCSTAHLSPQPRFRVSPAFPRAATSLARPAARNGARALPNFPASAARSRAGLTRRLPRRPTRRTGAGPEGPPRAESTSSV